MGEVGEVASGQVYAALSEASHLPCGHLAGSARVTLSGPSGGVGAGPRAAYSKL